MWQFLLCLSGPAEATGQMAAKECLRPWYAHCSLDGEMRKRFYCLFSTEGLEMNLVTLFGDFCMMMIVVLLYCPQRIFILLLSSLKKFRLKKCFFYHRHCCFSCLVTNYLDGLWYERPCMCQLFFWALRSFSVFGVLKYRYNWLFWWTLPIDKVE